MENQGQAPQGVTNFNEALDVLIQAVNHGKDKGIYGWADLSLIGQSLGLIDSLSKQAVKEAQEQQEAKLTPDVGTKEVVLEPNKD